NLFRAGTDTLILYHYMFPRHRNDKRRGPSSGPMAELPVEEVPCPSCTALLDNWEGAVPHVEGLGANIAAVAKAPIGRVAAFGARRGCTASRSRRLATHGRSSKPNRSLPSASCSTAVVV